MRIFVRIIKLQILDKYLKLQIDTKLLLIGRNNFDKVFNLSTYL